MFSRFTALFAAALAVSISLPLQAQGDAAVDGADSARYFGADVGTGSVVFVIDVSGSMVSRSRPRDFEPIVQKFTQALSSLAPGQSFGLVAFGDEAKVFRPQLTPAGPDSAKAALTFLDRYDPGKFALKAVKLAGSQKDPWKGLWQNTIHGGTRADLALEAAFALKPEVIVFLSDGDPTYGTRQARLLKYKPEGGKSVEINSDALLLDYVQQRQSAINPRILIRTIAYRAGGGKGFMSELAAQNGGSYVEIQ